MSTAAKSEVFRKMNTDGNLSLPNAWDAASARVFESGGQPQRAMPIICLVGSFGPVGGGFFSAWNHHTLDHEPESGDAPQSTLSSLG